MANDIYLIGEVGYEITLESVINQIGKTDPETPLNVHIHSQGGSVYDGLAIYNHLKNLGREVNTISSGLVASIASIIFLAGKKDTRKINKTDSFLIHLPSGMNFGNASDLEKTAQELRQIESKLADIYEAETGLSKDEALALMKEDKFLDVDFLKEKGFVSEIVEFKAVANLNNKKEIKMNKLSNEDKNWFESMFNSIQGLLKKDGPVNKIVQDANGVEIDFTDLEEDASPAVGDVAKVDGADADGEYVLPSGETYVFAAGSLTEIKDAEEEGSEELDALRAENADLKEKLQAAEANTATLAADVEASTALIAKIEGDFNDLKAKVESSFEWTGLEAKKKNETKSRSFFGTK